MLKRQTFLHFFIIKRNGHHIFSYFMVSGNSKSFKVKLGQCWFCCKLDGQSENNHFDSLYFIVGGTEIKCRWSPQIQYFLAALSQSSYLSPLSFLCIMEIFKNPLTH